MVKVFVMRDEDSDDCCLDVCNTVNDYADIVDDLFEKINESGDQVYMMFKSMIPTVEEMRRQANLMIDTYIRYNNTKRKEDFDVLQGMLDDVMMNIDVCKSRIYDLCKS